MSRVVEASPTKQFFVRMLTKGITLQDCILDLIDNSLDGARKSIVRRKKNGENPSGYMGYRTAISFSKEVFSISDNCGGISIDEATRYAFHFGRRPDAPEEADFPIGLYGIGMKRAIFKIGNLISISSSTEKEAFSVEINVNKWLDKKEAEWEFELVEQAPQNPGTEIKITEILPDIAIELSDRLFANQLVRIIARDYSFFLQQGFEVVVNGNNVQPYAFGLKESATFQPIKMAYTDETGVQVEIVAGLVGAPSDETSPDATSAADVEYSGWFVACNDRTVLAADKGPKTVWGDDGFPLWHPQYNGFMGIVNFKSADPKKLPWTTTKREIEITNALYRRTLLKMKEITRAWIDYTNDRKEDPEQAHQLEKDLKSTLVQQLPERPKLVVPSVVKRERVEYTYVQYRVKKADIVRVAQSLGDRHLSNTQVGIKTFQYYIAHELEGA